MDLKHLSSNPVTVRQMTQRGVTAGRTSSFRFPAAVTNLTQENNEGAKI